VYLTQYCLKPVSGGGRLLTHTQRTLLCGTHPRQSQPASGEVYVAGLDLAGGADDEDGGAATRAGAAGRAATASASMSSRRDSTVLTIARLAYPESGAIIREPRVEIVEHCAWTGAPHETLLPGLIDLLRDVWRVRRVAVDATGLGETAARLIAVALGASRVEQVKFTAELGFELLASINGSRLKLYRGDGSPEYREFQRQMEVARVAYRANRTMNFFVDPSEGHDDYVVSSGLAVRASQGAERRVASGRVRA